MKKIITNYKVPLSKINQLRIIFISFIYQVLCIICVWHYNRVLCRAEDTMWESVQVEKLCCVNSTFQKRKIERNIKLFQW